MENKVPTIKEWYVNTPSIEIDWEKFRFSPLKDLLKKLLEIGYRPIRQIPPMDNPDESVVTLYKDDRMQMFVKSTGSVYFADGPIGVGEITFIPDGDICDTYSIEVHEANLEQDIIDTYKESDTEAPTHEVVMTMKFWV